MNPSLRAVLVAVLGAAVLMLLNRWVIWPLLFHPGYRSLQQPGGRFILLVLGAVPAVVGGFLAARLAPEKPYEHALAVGVLLTLPVLWTVPMMLRFYRQVPQSPVPFVVAVALRPLGAAAGAWLNSRLRPTAPPPPAPDKA